MNLRWSLIAVLAGIWLGGCSLAQDSDSDGQGEPAADSAAIRLGDGERNWIKIARVTRSGAVLTVPEVLIEMNGWLVIHRFKDGKPYGKDYLAATYINQGVNLDVPITLPEPPAPDTPLLIMLHADVNQNEQFDFVFVDEVNVLDKAVFEGATMVAKTFVTP